MEGWEPLT